MSEKVNKIQSLGDIVKRDVTNLDDEGIKKKEDAILELGQLLSKNKQANDLLGLIHQTRPFLNQISKAKAAKIVKTLIDSYLDMEAETGKEVQLCLECIEWAQRENRTFLRQALEARLIALYFDTKDYENALTLGANLLKELKKLDDKALLVEVQLLESKVYHALSNLPRARAALTSARTTANGIYCPPKLQAALDLQSGILHAADERDFKTAYSYFYEAFEGYDSVDNPRAILALKYMTLSKIMLNQAEEVSGILGGKLALKYSGEAIEGMRCIANASHKRSLADFNQTMVRYKTQLEDDPIVKAHLNTLYDSLLEQNLCRIIEPYMRVQVLHVAELIHLPIDIVEKKLSQMILDRKFHGVLDQGSGVLIIFDELNADKTYECVLESIQSMGKVVDALYNKAKKLT